MSERDELVGGSGDTRVGELHERLRRQLVADLGELPDVETGPAAVTAGACRVWAPARRVGDGAEEMLLLAQETDGSWMVRGLRVASAAMVGAARAVLRRAGQVAEPEVCWRWYLRDPRDLTDAHLATECPACTVVRARCGAVFKPAVVFMDGGLPLQEPPDERACADCQAQQTGAP